MNSVTDAIHYLYGEENEIIGFWKSDRYFDTLFRGEPDANNIEKINLVKLLEHFKSLKIVIGTDFNWDNFCIRPIGEIGDCYTVKIAFFTAIENLVVNSYRWGRQMEKTKITVEIIDNINQIELVYYDNGDGFIAEAISKINKWINGDFTAEEIEKNKGAGIYSIQKAIDLIGGTIEWPSEVGSSIVSIYFCKPCPDALIPFLENVRKEEDKPILPIRKLRRKEGRVSGQNNYNHH